jgi:hypothetical protein
MTGVDPGRGGGGCPNLSNTKDVHSALKPQGFRWENLRLTENLAWSRYLNPCLLCPEAASALDDVI